MTEEIRHVHAPPDIHDKCDACGGGPLVQRREQQQFPYGKPGEQVELVADVPVWHCTACGFEFTDEAAEDARHEAVCHHLRVLTPREIRELRLRRNLSQAALAELTGHGEASIKRWELGLNIQNSSADHFLRVLMDDDVFDKVRRLFTHTPAENPKVVKSKFRTSLPSSAYLGAGAFDLRL